MLTELNLYQLGTDMQKRQTHASPSFPCSAYYTNWSRQGLSGTPWHWHEDIEFLFVKEGSVLFRCGGMESVLAAGDGLYVNRKGLHRIEMAGENECRVRSILCDARLLGGTPGTAVDRKYIHPLTGNRAFAGMALYSKDPEHSVILSHASAAHEACAVETEGYELEARYHLSKALFLIGQLSRTAGRKKKEEGVREERIRLMLDHIHENYAQPLTLSDLSDAAGICEREVQRCFRTALGTSAMQYLQQYRIRTAAQMLLDSDDSVLQIGISCGFSNPSHFSKVFHEVMGCTPHTFRQQNTAVS